MDDYQAVSALFEEHFGYDSIKSQANTHETEIATAGDWNDLPEENEEPLAAHDRIRFVCQQNDEAASSSSDDSDVLCESLPLKCDCGKNCMSKFDVHSISEHKLNLQEMDKTEKELLIIGSLQRHTSESVRGGKRKRVKVSYMFHGINICRNAYKSIYDIGDKTLKSIMKHIKENGQVPRIHGNTGRKPYNALKYQDIKNAVDFLDNFARLNGIPMPSAPKGRNEEPPVFLSSKETKKAIHTTYRESCCESGHRPLGLTAFRDTWRQCLPHIKIASPREDVCSTCESLRRRVSKASTEDEKLEASTLFTTHIQKAQLERECYINEMKMSTKELEGNERCQGPVPPNSTNLAHVHYTIDYCQSVTLPHYARQIGQLYFISGRKVNIFAVRLDGVPVQYNYLIDENQSIGADGSGCQGPNGVISMLHDCLFRNGYGERRCVIHADNCAGQNKNQFMIGYLLWRLHQGLHEEIELKMQVPGHTRCCIDGAFGHLKKLYRRVDVETVTDLADVVNKSSKTNRAVLFQDSRGEQNWVWYDWKSFLKRFYKPLKGISRQRIFRVSTTDKTSVFVKESTDGNEVKVTLLKTVPPLDSYPDMIVPPGLTDTRIEYLRRHVRPLVSNENKDYMAPQTQEE